MSSWTSSPEAGRHTRRTRCGATLTSRHDELVRAVAFIVEVIQDLHRRLVATHQHFEPQSQRVISARGPLRGVDETIDGHGGRCSGAKSKGRRLAYHVTSTPAVERTEYASCRPAACPFILATAVDARNHLCSSRGGGRYGERMKMDVGRQVIKWKFKVSRVNRVQVPGSSDPDANRIESTIRRCISCHSSHGKDERLCETMYRSTYPYLALPCLTYLCVNASMMLFRCTSHLMREDMNLCSRCRNRTVLSFFVVHRPHRTIIAPPSHHLTTCFLLLASPSEPAFLSESTNVNSETLCTCASSRSSCSPSGLVKGASCPSPRLPAPSRVYRARLVLLSGLMTRPLGLPGALPAAPMLNPPGLPGGACDGPAAGAPFAGAPNENTPPPFCAGAAAPNAAAGAEDWVAPKVKPALGVLLLPKPADEAPNPLEGAPNPLLVLLACPKPFCAPKPELFAGGKDGVVEVLVGAGAPKVKGVDGAEGAAPAAGALEVAPKLKLKPALGVVGVPGADPGAAALFDCPKLNDGAEVVVADVAAAPKGLAVGLAEGVDGLGAPKEKEELFGAPKPVLALLLELDVPFMALPKENPVEAAGAVVGDPG